MESSPDYASLTARALNPFLAHVQPQDARPSSAPAAGPIGLGLIKAYDRERSKGTFRAMAVDLSTALSYNTWAAVLRAECREGAIGLDAMTEWAKRGVTAALNGMSAWATKRSKPSRAKKLFKMSPTVVSGTNDKYVAEALVAPFLVQTAALSSKAPIPESVLRQVAIALTQMRYAPVPDEDGVTIVAQSGAGEMAGRLVAIFQAVLPTLTESIRALVETVSSDQLQTGAYIRDMATASAQVERLAKAVTAQFLAGRNKAKSDDIVVDAASAGGGPIELVVTRGLLAEQGVAPLGGIDLEAASSPADAAEQAGVAGRMAGGMGAGMNRKWPASAALSKTSASKGKSLVGAVDDALALEAATNLSFLDAASSMPVIKNAKDKDIDRLRQKHGDDYADAVLAARAYALVGPE